jgi:hypothetical protein
MSSDDDVAYRRSVRNMSIVLAAIVITVFAALFVPPYVNPSHIVFQKSVSLDSPFGFTLHLKLNATSVPSNGIILLTGWVNNTSSAVENVTAANGWAFESGRLTKMPCTSGWPIGFGLMAGHFTQDNYTLGVLIPIPQPMVLCPVPAASPNYFLFEPHSSTALVTIGGNPFFWKIQTSLTLRQQMLGHPLQAGVYTAVLADEWGDVLTANFQVT